MGDLHDNSPIPFGKFSRPPHGPKTMQQVSASYLDWLHGELDAKSRKQELNGDEKRVLAYIEKNRNVIDKELEEQERI